MTWNKTILAGAVLVAAFTVIGCEKKEETIGTKIDKAVDKSKEAVKDGADNAKEAIKDGADKTKEVAKDAADATKDAVK